MNWKNKLKKYDTMERDLIKERLDITQEVIDRLIYLSPEEADKYKKELDKLNLKFNINAGYEEGIRVIKTTKN